MRWTEEEYTQYLARQAPATRRPLTNAPASAPRGTLVAPADRYRSHTERRFVLECLTAWQDAGQIHTWLYEPLRFRLGERATYTPDFLVIGLEGVLQFVEVKGAYVREDAWLKLKWVRESYPFWTFTLAQYAAKRWTYTNKELREVAFP